MLNFTDLKHFLTLPPVFNKDAIKAVEQALDEYFDCKAYIRRQLECYGEDAYRKAEAYDEVELDIKGLELPNAFEEKFLAVIRQQKKEYCG